MRFRSAAAWQPVSTIIIVEDDCSVNLAVSRLLQAAGFGVRSFTSGNAVLADDEAREADCIVLDVHLPDMNGSTCRPAGSSGSNGRWWSSRRTTIRCIGARRVTSARSHT